MAAAQTDQPAVVHDANSNPLPAGERPGDADPAVAVFAPALLLLIEIHSNSGETDDVHLHAGGQGYWVARMIRALGVRAIPCSPVGGEPGNALREITVADGLDARLTPMSQSNAVIIEDRRDNARTTIVETGFPHLGRHDVDELYSSIVGAAMSAGVCVLTGTQQAKMFEPDIFRRLVSDLRRNQITVVADLSEEPLHAALQAGVDVLKLSHEELLADGWAKTSGTDAIVKGIRRLQRAGAASVVVSRSDRSTIVGDADRIIEVRSPALEVVDGRGGGDSMTAALAVAAAHQKGFDDALRIAAAAATLNVSRHGLGTGRRDSIEELAAHVDIIEITNRRPTRSVARSSTDATTKADLYRRAQQLDIPGRSTMSRSELITAIQQSTGR
jgi:1-phosphofructokinase